MADRGKRGKWGQQPSEQILGPAEDKLKHIRAIQKVNEDIIKRLQQGDQQTSISGYDAVLTFSCNEHGLKWVAEQHGTRKSQTVASFRTQSVLVEIDDIFNDKLIFQCYTFQDIVRLNASMLPVAEKYSLFGGSPQSLQYLEQYHENYRRLQDMLGELEQRTMDVQRDSAKEELLRKHINEINQLFAKVKDLMQTYATVDGRNPEATPPGYDEDGYPQRYRTQSATQSVQWRYPGGLSKKEPAQVSQK